MTPRRARVALVVAPAVIALLVLTYVYVIFPLRFRGGPPTLPEDVVSALKVPIAVGALGLSTWAAFRRAIRRPLPARAERVAVGAFAALAIVGYLGFGDVGYARGYHRWEMFHYYLGAKYQAALRYDAIYAATAVAQAELSPAMRKEVEARQIRNLDADQIVSAKLALDDADAIKSRFRSAEEWEAFKQDVGFFRRVAHDVKWWNDMQRDHGFNGSPVWMLAGQPLARIAPASELSLRALASIDVGLFAALFACVAWAFGWRTAGLAIVFWGTQWPFDKAFTFGAFLRQDWLFLLVLSACLAKKRYYAAAGAALAWSTLLRLFPGVLFVPLAVGAAARLRAVRDLRSRALRPFVRVFAGAALASAVLGASAVAFYGPSTTRDFVARIATHNTAPAGNLMGLKSIVAFSWSSRMERARVHGAPDELAHWREVRQEHAVERRPLFAACALAMLAFTVAVVANRRRPLWALLPLGVPLVFGAGEMSNYYLSFFLLLPLLRRYGARIEILILATSAASAALLPWGRVSNTFDSRCYFQSWVFLVAAIVAAVAVGVRRRRRRRPIAAPA